MNEASEPCAGSVIPNAKPFRPATVALQRADLEFDELIQFCEVSS